MNGQALMPIKRNSLFLASHPLERLSTFTITQSAENVASQSEIPWANSVSRTMSQPGSVFVAGRWSKKYCITGAMMPMKNNSANISDITLNTFALLTLISSILDLKTPNNNKNPRGCLGFKFIF